MKDHALQEVLLKCFIVLVDCFISGREDCCFLLVIIDFNGDAEMRTCACNLHVSKVLVRCLVQEESVKESLDALRRNQLHKNYTVYKKRS